MRENVSETEAFEHCWISPIRRKKGMEFSSSLPLSRFAWGCLGAALLAGVSLDSTAAPPLSNRETVGHKEGGRSVTPVNQTLTPLGRQIELTGLRPQALALSPDGSRLLVSGKTSQLLVLSPVTGEILQRVALPSEQVNEPQPAVPSPNILKPDAKGQVSYTGLIYSPDGKRVFLSNVNGSLKVFRVGPDGMLSASHSLPLPAAGPSPRTRVRARSCSCRRYLRPASSQRRNAGGSAAAP